MCTVFTRHRPLCREGENKSLCLGRSHRLLLEEVSYKGEGSRSILRVRDWDLNGTNRPVGKTSIEHLLPSVVYNGIYSSSVHTGESPLCRS